MRDVSVIGGSSRSDDWTRRRDTDVSGGMKDRCMLTRVNTKEADFLIDSVYCAVLERIK